MEEQFIDYNSALALKELGFDGRCLATIDQTEYLHLKGDKNLPRGSMMYDIISCPTYGQAFKFFRGKYKLSGEIHSSQFYFTSQIIFETTGDNQCKWIKDKYKTYEEAEKECLIKLIEICQK